MKTKPNWIKEIVFTILSPILGMVIYSISSIIYSISSGEINDTIPGIVVFLSANIIVFIAIEKTASWINSTNPIVYKISILIYAIITSIGMLFASYPWYYYIIVVIAIGYFFRGDNEENFDY